MGGDARRDGGPDYRRRKDLVVSFLVSVTASPGRSLLALMNDSQRSVVLEAATAIDSFAIARVLGLVEFIGEQPSREIEYRLQEGYSYGFRRCSRQRFLIGTFDGGAFLTASKVRYFLWHCRRYRASFHLMAIVGEKQFHRVDAGTTSRYF